jgi:hypothetical protein
MTPVCEQPNIFKMIRLIVMLPGRDDKDVQESMGEGKE